MLFIDNKGINDPRINLAIEEFAVTNLDIDETYLLFYINEPSIIIGKNQNTFEEINSEYVQEKGIHVVRRLSGGGAVYHDLGNLNFSFITKREGEDFRKFTNFTEPVTAALHDLGVNAELTGRNDLQIGNKKISGNAQYTTQGRMFNHGTLLFDVDLESVSLALRVKADKIKSKGIKSIRNRVANIKEYLTHEMTIEEFREKLITSIFKSSPIQEYQLTKSDWEQVYQISRRRYRNWDWNYGKSPDFNISNSKRFSIGAIDIRLSVKNGWIEQCKIFGDFFGGGELRNVEEKLISSRYTYEDIRNKIEEIDLLEYFGNITVDEFLSLF